MIKFPNGRSISNVLFSSALGHSGGGLVPYYPFHPLYMMLLEAIRETGTISIAKSATFGKRVGNFILHDPRTWRAIQRLPKMGMLNSFGLTNDGVRACAYLIANAFWRGYNVIPSFFPEFSKGIETVIRETLAAIGVYVQILGDDFWVLKLNVSCPNSGEDFTRFTREVCRLVEQIKVKFPWLIILVRISIRHPYEFSKEVKRAGADVIDAINTVPYAMVFDAPSPIADLGGGGVSGNPAHPLSWPYCIGLREILDGSMIWNCVATNRDHIRTIFNRFGRENNSVSMCTAAVRDPLEARRAVLEFNG